MKRKVVLGLVAGIAALAIPGAVRAVPDVAEGVEARPAWRVEAAASYVASGPFDGWGLGVRAGWAPIPMLQFGVGVDSATLRAEGTYY